jgi:hypothetical protein
MVRIFDPACELLPPWTKELQRHQTLNVENIEIFAHLVAYDSKVHVNRNTTIVNLK